MSVVQSCLRVRTAVCALAMLGLSACGGGSSGNGRLPDGGGNGFKTFQVCSTLADADARNAEFRDQALIAFFEASEGDTIEFCAGRFDVSTGLFVHSKRGLTIRGAGIDKTILNFLGSDSSEGINVSHSDGVTLQGFSVEDTPGNGVRIFRSRFVTIRDVLVRWRDYVNGDGLDENDDGYQPNEEMGAYALYPVETEHVLIEDSVAIGASDAGIYVGQSNDIIVRRTLAMFNVAGYEFENTYRAVFEDNVATRNTGGFLVFDLPNLRQYGQKNIVRRNKSFDNNTENFAPVGNIVGLVPRGTGMLILASDQTEVYDNEIYDNDTVGLAVVGFGLVEPKNRDLKLDFFPNGLNVYRNVFRDNGGNPQEPDLDRGEASVLPYLLVLRNGGRGAHIVWDGAVDEPRPDCPMPVDAAGIPLDQPNPNETRYEERVDERGRPNYQRSDPEPECRFNMWKFDGDGELKDENWIYIAHGGDANANTFENTRPETVLVSDFLNANITSSDPEVLLQDLLLKQPSNDLGPHAGSLPPYQEPVLNLPFVPDPNSAEARPSQAEVDAACNGGAAGQINWNALLRFNCPRLDQYGLYADPEDPRANPVGDTAVPFELTTALFSDYAHKYRVLFVPPGEQVVYRDHTHEDPAHPVNVGVTATMEFPVGTVIAKTFTFPVQDAQGNLLDEDIVETRLLIRRESATGVRWVGLPYIWQTDADTGLRVAVLKVQGGTHTGSFDYQDPDPEVVDAEGNRKRYQGTVANYTIPAALNCITCHGGDDRESGAAPIGLKPRLLNRDNSYADAGTINQLQYLQMRGLLTGLPEDPDARERLPRWNVPGDAGDFPGSGLDVQKRARAYLETNCMHCHQSDGNASNSGLLLNYFRNVDRRHGICKRPVAAGRGSGDKPYDIVPGAPGDSILYYRMANSDAGVRMPPVARTVGHTEAIALISDWINRLPMDGGDQDNQTTRDHEVCTGPFSPVTGQLPLPLGELPLNELPSDLAESIGGLLGSP